MDGMLTLMALGNLVTMLAVFAPRGKNGPVVMWSRFPIALLATELAWLWLPLQILIVWLLGLGDAPDSDLGEFALRVVIITWLGFAWAIWKSAQAGDALEMALVRELGPGYRRDIPAGRAALLREEMTFGDWNKPFSMARPDVEVITNIAYAPGGIRQRLDIYRPRQLPDTPCPVLLQIHGGGWVFGDKGSQALPLMQALASRGWICVAANYRLSPSVGFPTLIEDCKAALCWIREHGAEYGMDTSFVAVTGGSAGGHLAALMGLTANRPEFQAQHPDTDTSVQACVPFYGVYDLLSRYDQQPNPDGYRDYITDRIIHASPEEDPQLWDLVSPVEQIHADAPPFMVLQGTHDSLVFANEGRVFAQRLRAASEQPVVYAELPGAEHAFDTIHSLRTERSIDAVHRFLEWVRREHDTPTADPKPA